MMRRFVSGVFATAVLSSALLLASEARAQEIELTGPLKGAPAVRSLRLYREGRFEVAPTVSFTLLDEYRRTIFVGGRLTYYITDWLGIGAWAGFGAASLTTDLTDKINATAPRSTNGPTATQVNHDANGNPLPFANQTGQLNWELVPQVTFIPFRGKFAIFQKIFVDTDLYLAVGPAFAGVTERQNCGAQGQVSCTDPASFNTTGRTAITVSPALGLSFFAAGFFSFGIEYRAVPFSWNRSGFDSRGSGTNQNFPDGKIDSNDRTFDFNQMVTLVFGFSFPTAPRISE